MAWPMQTSIFVFIVSAAVIGVVGYYITSIADRLADRLKIGESLAGGVLLGVISSLPDTMVTVTAAMDGFPQMAVSNGVGGIAAQTMFLAVADLTYRKANLEHAAASLPNLVFSLLLLGLLAVPLWAHFGPEAALFGVHPISFMLIAIFVFGIRLVQRSHDKPMWMPRRTRQTVEDEPQATPRGERATGLWLRFFIFALFLGFAGWAITKSAESLVIQSNLSEAVVGGIFTAVATSLPELIIAIVAVRQGALVLAVGNVIGGNAYDALQIPLADFFYREGSIYHHLGRAELFLMTLTLVMTIALALGLLGRQEKGVGRMGWDGLALFILYGGGMWMLYQL